MSCNLCRFIEQILAGELATVDLFALGFVAGAKAACAGAMPRLCAQHLKEIAVMAEAHNVRLIEVESDEKARELRAELEMTAFRVAPGRAKT